MKAIAYLRTSSAANVGADKDSDTRQRLAIDEFAKAARYEVVGEFYDPAVSGADPIEARPGFAAMLDRIEGNGVRTIIVEDADRFARGLVTQELGVLLMVSRGVRVLTSKGEELTDTSDPLRNMFRQIAGSFAEYEKARLVGKLRGARDRKSAEAGRRIEGRKSRSEIDPELARRAKALRRKPRKGKRPSLRIVQAALAAEGYTSSTGKPIALATLQNLLGET